MADYWKSQPKKFCEFCKCWLSDNKVSRDFHENGKRHQESVKKKLQEAYLAKLAYPEQKIMIHKKTAEDAKNKKEASSFLDQMEKAAMQKLKEDLVRDPSLANQYGVTIRKKQPEQEPASSAATSDTSSSSSSNQPDSADVWQVAYSPEGYPYYWNSLTNETSWELPAGATAADHKQEQLQTNQAAAEAAESSSSTAKEESKSKAEELKSATDSEKPNIEVKMKKPAFKMNTKVVKSNKSEDVVKTEVAEIKKETEKVPEKTKYLVSPYGSWSKVEQIEEAEVDYELPVNPQSDLLNIEIPEEPEQVKMKFTERKISRLDDETGGANEGFKKRRLNNSGIRNIRKNNDEES